MKYSSKQQLEDINQVSRQLLSRILSADTESTPPIPDSNLEQIEDQSTLEETKEIVDIVKKRQLLITRLFEQSTPESLNHESDLMKEMIDLDRQLTHNAQICKQTVTQKLIKIKKSKKVTQSYQKY